jgi:large subunit ribosomal protein L15e
MKGLYHQLKKNWQEQSPERIRELMNKWKSENKIVKLERPTRLDKARSLGYKAKKGFVVVRIRILRGGRKRERPRKGRKGRNLSIKKVLKMNYRWVAEQRVQKKFVNLEVLNSYYLAKGGQHYFYEVILVDPSKPEIIKDKTINWITKPRNRGRAFRGLTSAGKKSRGLRNRQKNLKVRPSLRAWHRLGK